MSSFPDAVGPTISLRFGVRDWGIGVAGPGASSIELKCRGSFDGSGGICMSGVMGLSAGDSLGAGIDGCWFDRMRWLGANADAR